MKTRPTPVASAVALALTGTLLAARAQQAPVAPAAPAVPAAADATQTIEVTGIRASLQTSLKQKRDADNRVEVITAEDIGKMPDKNVADSLQRVAGVTISSSGANEGGFDENDRVSMRGTNPSLTQTTINGHGVASGDWFVLSQSGTVGRSVSYTLLPSEIVGSVVVHKSSQASLLEGGVVGSVDIITRKPLEFRKAYTLEVSAGVVYADLPGKTDPQFNALANWKNEQGNAGVLLQVFSETRHLRRDGQELLGYEQIKAGSAVATAHPDLANVWYPVLIGSTLFEQKRERTGGLIDFQLKPSQDLSLDLSAFTSKLKASNYNRNYMLWGTHVLNQGSGQSPNAGYVVQNGTLTSATFAALAGSQYGIYDQISRPGESATSSYLSLDGSLRVNSRLKFDGKIGTSRGDGKTPTQDVAEWNTGVGTGAAWQLNGIGGPASWNLGAQNNTSPAGSTLSWIFGDQNIDVKDKDNWAQIDGEWSADAGALSKIKFGLRLGDHSRSSGGVIGQGPTGCCDATNPASPFDPVNFPQGAQNYPSNFGSGIGGSGYPTGVWYYTPAQLAQFNNAYANRATDGSREDWNSEYALKENSNAAYVQGNLDGPGWAGNVGLRLVQTKERVTNNVAAGANQPGAITTSAFGPYIPVTVTHTYNDPLPSANLRLDLRSDLVARFALSRTITRPDYSALGGAVSLSPPGGPGGTGSGSGGNPDLKPVRSTNLDATIEWYFGPRSLLTASAFYMDLTSYIGYGSVIRPYTTFDAAHPQGYVVNYNLTVPVNSSGKVQGLELAWEQPLSANIGVNVNATYVDAHETGGGALVGASRQTGNVGAYYEDEKFNARIGWNYRSSFYSGLDRSTAFFQGATQNLSATVGYKITQDLSVTLDGRNLNNPVLKYYALNESQPRAFYSNGRQYFLTVRAKF